MKKPYRMRPGKGNDVIYETKRWWLFFVPNFFGMGFYPYANAASARNRHAQELNDLSEKIVHCLDKYAKAESVLMDEKAELEDKELDKFGISPIEYLPNSFIKDMLPYKPYVKEDFRKVINKQVIDRSLRDHGVNTNRNKNTSNGRPGKPDVIITSEDGRHTVDSSMAHHVLTYKSEKEKKNSSGNNQNQNKKQLRKKLRSKNPRYDDEDEQEYNERISSLLED